jgi:hypothetical protein
MGLSLPIAVLCAANLLAQTQQTAPSTTPPPVQGAAEQPLPPVRELLLDVEHNQMAAEAARADYTYHVHLEDVDLDGKGNPKKTTVTDSESITIQGVRVDRVVARDGKPLTAEEAKKEDERIDKEVAKDKERKEKERDKGKETTSRGDEIITVSRILELGAFTNPRRVDYNGRPTILLDYAGDPSAKTRSSAEGVIRDLVGEVWIDERDRVLVRGQGHFLNDFKIGGGLVLSIHKGLNFDFSAAKIHGEVWLPSSIEAQGSARILLFDGVHGRLKMATSDYRKFSATSKFVSASGTDAQPPADPAAAAKPVQTAPAQPQR